MSKAKQLFLEVLEEDGEKIPEPDLLKAFSGQTRLRLPKSLHAALSREARKEGVSLNTYIVQLLSERNALNQVIRHFSEEVKRLEKKLDNLRNKQVTLGGCPTR